MTTLIHSVQDWQSLRNSKNFTEKTIGFVPTMGNLHAGHQSLLERCRKENQIAILSIFVNPTQFNDPKDFERYPQTFAADFALAESLNIDYVFKPEYSQLYPDEYRYQVSENTFSQTLCGEFRPGHFTGMLSVVLKFLQLVKPKLVYFGEKDYQQLLLVKGMVEAFFLECEIIACPTVRSADGLALSSRNQLLTPTERELAPHFPCLLQKQASIPDISEALARLGFEVEYIEEQQGRRFGAVRLGKVRLIDNIPLF